eukprot:TRINITY_DN6172_c0_g3_i10.p1 TRINITY_DN6172_c0_g3~~TRINITY_DN6172_c0_g3_i10.p1  ORF type:complete len:184 (-),score=49.68 TRINITY_DN6172_c0_g3_i10:428-979(-)
MVEPLPNLAQFGAPMNPKLKGEKEFLHGLDKCHPLAIQQEKIYNVRNQMCNDIISKVNPGERGKERQGMVNRYAECVKQIENERKNYIEQFKGIYPNSDKMEVQIVQDQAKVKRVEENYKEANTLFVKQHNTIDAAGKEQATGKYLSALKTYKDSHSQALNEFRKSYLERMESTIVCFNLSDM